MCAAFLTISGRVGQYWRLLGLGDSPARWTALFACAAAFRRACGAFCGTAEQACNHFIAFKLLALHAGQGVHGRCGGSCPAKLEGRDKGDLICRDHLRISSYLEVFYAHTISPVGHRAS